MAVKLKAKWEVINYVKNFNYTGGQQTWTAPYAGYYKLEVWGAQGGDASTTYHGGYGAYSVGVTSSNADSKYYINVGGAGTKNQTNCPVSGGYNGGGDVCETRDATYEGTGGGATHIATVSGLLKNLSSYKDTGGTNISKEILIVAGGGGGGSWYTCSDNGYNCGPVPNTTYSGIGGNAGGYIGNDGDDRSSGGNLGDNYGRGGTQSAAGICGYELPVPNSSCWIPGNEAYTAISGGFGFGGWYNTCPAKTWGNSGGGSGWYGGGTSLHAGAGGGSSYIGSSNLISGGGIVKHMSCYSCVTSSDANTRTYSNTNISTTPTADYSKTGNGYARITYLGTSI